VLERVCLRSYQMHLWICSLIEECVRYAIVRYCGSEVETLKLYEWCVQLVRTQFC